MSNHKDGDPTIARPSREVLQFRALSSFMQPSFTGPFASILQNQVLLTSVNDLSIW